MEQEHTVAVNAAMEAGRKIAEIYHAQNFTVTLKANDKGPLTEADLAANDILCSHIQKSFPNDAILSEETTDNPSRLNNSRCWIIDPLDGTREFTLGIPEFAVSIGLVIDGAPIVGVVYNPITEECVSAIVGVGTYLNGTLVQTTNRAEVAGSHFLVSRSEHKKGWFKPWEDVADMTPMGSVAYKLARVAIGKAEATFTPKPRNEWDLCGGVACILGAGGNTSDGSGTPYQFNQPDPLNIGVCGTNGDLHEHVLQMMKEAGS